jgi:hypothetical protein
LVIADLEVTGHSPGWSPRVGAEPVVESRSRVVAVTNDDDSMTTIEGSTSGLNIDTRLVVEKVGVNLESSFNWSIGCNFSLDCGLRSKLTNRSRLLLVESDGRTIIARGWARRCRSTSRLVGKARLSGSTGGSQPVLNLGDITTLAAVTTVVTGNNVLSSHVVRGETSNASTPREFLSSTECPARTTLSLVSDWN